MKLKLLRLDIPHTTTTEEWRIQETEEDEENTKSVNIESDREIDEMNQPFALVEGATAPQSIVPISEQDCEIKQLIADHTKSDDENK